MSDAHGATLAGPMGGGVVMTKSLAVLLFGVFVVFGVFWQALGGFALDDALAVASVSR